MIDKNAFEFEMVNPEDDSALNNMTTISGQIYGTELIETSMEDVRNKKKTMVLKIDSVTSLMKEVEYQETAAEQTKMEAAQIHSDIMLRVYELMDMQQHVKKKNDMLSREACVQKKLLSTKMDALQLHVTSLLDKGDRYLELLDEMSRSLETRLTSAMMKKKLAIKKKKLAIKKKKGNEAFARAALANEESQMEKMEEESKRLKQEAVEISKLQEFLIDRGHLVTILHGEISDKCRDVKRLKEELDQVVLPDITRSIKKVKITGELYGYQKKIKGKLCAQMFAKCIKKVKIKGKLHEYQMFAKSIKKVKIKGKQHGSQMCAKSSKKLKIKGKQKGSQICAISIKKLKIKGKRKGSQMCAKSIKKLKIKGKRKGSQMCARSIKKLKIKGKRKGSQMCAKSIKKLKIKGKREGSQMCARSIKNFKIQDKRYGSRMCAMSIKKLKINSKLHGNQLCPKSIKQVKIKGKRQGGQMFAKSFKKVKIKGLQMVKKGGQLQITDANSDNFQVDKLAAAMRS